MTATARRRGTMLLAAAVTIIAGLTVHEVVDGPVGAFIGDMLYAALVYVLIGAIAPSARRPFVAAAALVLCTGVELLQSTGLPAALATRVPAAALVLGTTFQAGDLVAYAVGAAAALGGDALSRRAAGSSRGEPTTPS